MSVILEGDDVEIIYCKREVLTPVATLHVPESAFACMETFVASSIPRVVSCSDF